MILTFGDAATEDLYHGRPSARTRRIPPDVKSSALRKLDMLDAAHRLADLRLLPGNRLEALHGQRQGTFSLRVNDQWRLVFRWSDNGPREVALVDYH